MPRFYSPEWVAAFNEAVAGLDASATDTTGSLAASSGRFSVAQVVVDAPGGELTVTMTADDGHLSMALGDGGGHPPNVTISLSYADAAALSRGELEPAEAVAQGRVRVRGDLAVLVAGRALLAAAGERLGALQAATTY